MILRPTKIEDISRVIDIINQAKTYFKNNDIDQWQDGYPNEETIEKDIENNEAYVLEEDGVILGTCMVTIHGEPAYNRIFRKRCGNQQIRIVPWRTRVAFYSISIRLGFSGRAFCC